MITVFAVVLCLSLSAWAQKENAVVVERPITDTPGPSQCDAALSLVVNCGWEVQPPFTGWRRSGDPSFTSVVQGAPVHSGQWGLAAGPVNGLGCVEQDVNTEPGAKYDITFWLRNAQTPNRFQVSWNLAVIYDQTDMPDFPYTLSDNLPVGDTSVFHILAPSAGVSTNIKFCFFNVPDFFWFDDVVILATFLCSRDEFGACVDLGCVETRGKQYRCDPTICRCVTP